MKYYVFPYCFKVWITSVLFAPIIFLPIDYFSNPGNRGVRLSDITSVISGYLVFIIAGAVLSIITLLVFWTIGVIVYRSVTNMIHRKLIMSFIGGILTALTFLMFFFPMDVFNKFPIAIMSSYCVCIVGSSLAYRFD